MPLRDLAVTLIVFGSLPLIWRKPFIGVLMWTWLGLMNPHKLCWGFAWGMPFAQLVALTLLVSLLHTKDEPKRIPWTPLSRMLALFCFWMVVTTFFALYPTLAWEKLDKVWKIQLMVFITMMLLTSKERIDALVWVITISLGFYGVKGGIFTLTTGGGDHVLGPAGTFIGGNTEIGLAMVMIIPFLRYIQLTAEQQWLKRVMSISMGLTFVATLGTQSRGALAGAAVMGAFLLGKSRKKFVLLLMVLIVVPLAYTFMPEKWHDRMATIDTYEQDRSALGRINAWWMAWYLALDRPLVGGGFEAFQAPSFERWSPDSRLTFDAHSIYFKALGEHGFVGLFLFLGLGVLGLKSANSIIRYAKREPRLFWMRDLASMIYVSLIGYATAGLFLGLTYFDFFYTLLAVLVGLQRVMRVYQEEGIPVAEAPGVGTQKMVGSLAYSRGSRARHVAPAMTWGYRFRMWYERL